MLVPNLIVINYPKPTSGANALTHKDTIDGPVDQLSCMYSMTLDEDFVIDFLGGEFGQDVVVGGHGFKMGPTVGILWN
jgi:hypothetical protein